MVESSDKCGPLEKGKANHFSILPLKTPWTVWKGRKTWHWKMNPLEGVQYTTGEEGRNGSQRNEKAEWKQKLCLAVDVSGGESKGQCCKEKYCIGTWNVRSMNQSKLDKVKQEMARVNIHISELKWTGMGKFNSDDHYYLLLWVRIL